MALSISAYSTVGHTKSDHIRDPLVYKGSKYDHPADVLFKNLDALYDFTSQPAYLDLNDEQRFAAKHYLTAMNYCETGNWTIDSDLKKSSKSCQKVMSVYKELYMRGYSWGYNSAGDLAKVDPVFLNMPKIAKGCEKKRNNLAVVLNPNAKLQSFCNRKGGVTSRNGGLATVLAINLPTKNTASSPSKASTAKTNTSKSSSGINGVKTITIEPSKSNKSNRGRWLQVSEVIAIESGSQKDLAHIANKATTESTSTYSNQSHGNNAISGVGPDRYPNIFHSGSRDKAPSLKITLKQSSQLDSITLFGRADGNSKRDIYDLTLHDKNGKTILKRANLNASGSSHAVKIDFIKNNQATAAALAKPIKTQKKINKAEMGHNTQSRSSNASTASKVKRYQEYSQLFSQANNAKANKDFDSAKKLYNKVLNESKLDPVLSERELSIQIMTAKRELKELNNIEDKTKRNALRQEQQKASQETSQQFTKAYAALATGDLDVAEKIYKDLLQYPHENIVKAANQGLDKVASRREEQNKINSIANNPEGNALELAIAATLPEIERLPVLYVNESRKWYKKDRSGTKALIGKQALTRKLIDKYPFPMNRAESIADIDKRHAKLAALKKNLDKKLREILRAYPYESGGRNIPLDQQHKIANQVLYPSLVAIQSETIEMLSRVPRTIEGLEKAYDLMNWLFNNRLDSDWDAVIINHAYSARLGKVPSALCTYETNTNQVALDPKTGRCFLEIELANYLLRHAWRIQYMREIDTLLSQKIKADGIELHINAFLLAFDMQKRLFDDTDFSKADYSPTQSNQKCLFDNCSSKLTRLFISEYSGKPLSNERKKHYLATLEKKSKELLDRWNASAGQSKSDRYTIQTDIVSYAREVVKGIIDKLSHSAAKELISVPKDDYEGYKKWNIETARRIRLQAEAWRKLWDIGFGIGTKENAQSALGLSSFTDGYLRARHSGGSPFVGIAEIL